MNMEGQETMETQQINAGNPSDFKKIYEECMQVLFRISIRIVNDEEVAEDLAHDSMIKANEKSLVFPSLDDCKYWLIRVVKNASLNYVKRKDREHKAYEKALIEDHRHYDGGEVDVMKAEAIKRVQECLEKLPKKLKEVIILREYGDLNYKEIGKVLGITEGNVKIRIFRAREQLEKLIGEENVFMPN